MTTSSRCGSAARSGPVINAAAAHGIVDVVSREPNLEDVFLAQYGDHPVEVAG